MSTPSANHATRATTPALQSVVPGVWGLRDVFANLYFVRNPNSPADPWVLIDAGLPGSGDKIKQRAEEIFGPNNPPAAILLTHGHFDHVGALPSLLEAWPSALVYAHPLELPYLTGRSSYPPPDPTVGKGLMATMSFLYPKKPIDLGGRVKALPEDGSVPFLAGWRWVFTPGHTPGHVSFFREYDRTLVVGDAFVTVFAESGTATYTQQQEVHGPPAYFTPNWQQARESVARLAELEPQVAAAGHGIPMQGEEMRRQLQELVRDFDKKAVPAQGRYVQQAAQADETGVVSLPPAAPVPLAWWLAGGAVVLGAALLASRTGGGSSSGVYDLAARRARKEGGQRQGPRPFAQYQ
ncbi:MBL fold metallo-hydrolase [Hymenobacter weizhouensis]|uniref:MBL fold metallo-hydrolase n=1 Tax=Hymenobacter sp. YIM 151500-1 TaxID=2987689 RepID=UPI0022278202|nr:MBL fold metallo-hydrolase [Hymenobacter sp. YIM 151500-1]UYZ63447.1 MBL fold metallo-hydrolase [Hymenobacter sp. YIM 151500-1]